MQEQIAHKCAQFHFHIVQVQCVLKQMRLLNLLFLFMIIIHCINEYIHIERWAFARRKTFSTCRKCLKCRKWLD